MRSTVLPAVVAVALALGACSSDGADPEPTAMPSQTTEAAPAPTDSPAPGPTTEDPEQIPTDESDEPSDAQFSTEDQQNPEYPSSVGTDGPLFPTGARVSSHDGYDRVVVDFEGTGSPGWLVRYVEEPVADDSGMEVDLTGDVVLRIDASGLSTPATEDFDVDQIASGHYDTSQADRVQDVYASGIFEGWSGSLVGLDETAPFRVFTLTEPTRLVVDISTEAG